MSPRRLVAALTLSSLLLAWAGLTGISRTDPWYRNAETNMPAVVDALALNSGQSPAGNDQPGFPPRYLLALDYRVRHYAGLLPVWNFKKLGASADPLQELPPLIEAARLHSRILVMLFILSAAGLVYAVTRNFECAGLAAMLLSGSSGLLFHGLLARPELLCAGLGNVLALFCVWQATSIPPGSGMKNQLWLFLAGLCGGLATLTQLPGMFYLVAAWAWCWLAALTAPPTPAPDKPNFWSGLLPAVSGAAMLWLLAALNAQPDAFSPVAILRLRTAAVLVATLPLLALWTGRNRGWSLLLERSRELALLGGGALSSLTLGYVALRGVLPEPRAAEYLTGILQLVSDPGPPMRSFLPAQPHLAREFFLFFKETPFLFAGGLAVALGLGLRRSIPSRLRAFLLLLLGLGLGMTLLMSRHYFRISYPIFAQVPLLLIGPLALFGLGVWRSPSTRAEPGHWAVPVALAAALVLVLTVYLRVQPRYDTYEPDSGLPVSDLTLTLLYDSDAYPKAYRQIMETRYGGRMQFRQALDRYLAAPADRP